MPSLLLYAKPLPTIVVSPESSQANILPTASTLSAGNINSTRYHTPLPGNIHISLSYGNSHTPLRNYTTLPSVKNSSPLPDNNNIRYLGRSNSRLSGNIHLGGDSGKHSAFLHPVHSRGRWRRLKP